MRWSIEQLARRRFEVIPLTVTLLAAAGVWTFLVVGESIKDRLGEDLAGMTYQFLLIIVLGSGVSVLFQTVAYGREMRERRRTLQREIHDSLVSGYNDAKRARRLLRARARASSGDSRSHAGNTIDAAEYDRQLEALSSAQLSLELAMRRVVMNRTFFAHHAELIAALRMVTNYLNAIIDEWEDMRPRLISSGAIFTISDLPELDAFLRHYASAPRFREGFKKPFDDALELLEKALVAD